MLRGKTHHGIPSFVAPAPFSYYQIPDEERAHRCSLGSDDCVIDETLFFVRGNIEIPVHGFAEPFTWGVWLSVSEASFQEWVRTFHVAKRSHVGPFFGWLNTQLSVYPDTINLKTMVHLRNDGIRPYVSVEPTDHPLALEQRHGISRERVAQIYRDVTHPDDSAR
ncbi:hypothetical protein WT67_27840 [Burkholderia stagnalis]|uniref:DUF2199 domain-containing protein n=1 Tax=Burkholderia stagnalis TaxID=1503054 RepID=A0A6L3MQ13_9BURK|nr:DUF2199 domain-containing protein [Burkholderia stagnalis]KAB0634250.1 DUF2199 domain-containing protein [Burkholderia stagnalis]KVL84387.1 hypothetical protein WT03_03690 [Burkholderia stagnalis]KVL98608.1 hypothetical protein WT02_11460 [Burkholderia stagnalis]KVM16899.1 hypothetical protein WT04_04440 [Burkholderia stagnalis]KVO35052.1 hypothetical protein WT17_27090 [Burkholderia stagnalis]